MMEFHSNHLSRCDHKPILPKGILAGGFLRPCPISSIAMTSISFIEPKILADRIHHRCARFGASHHTGKTSDAL